jgi:hypothetical protein
MAHLMGKLSPPLLRHWLVIEGAEVAVAALMKSDQNGHDFTQAHGALAMTLLETMAQEALTPAGLEGLAKVIDMAK